MSPQFKMSSFPKPRLLRPLLPRWAFGLEGDWLGRQLATALAGQSLRLPRLQGVNNALAVWNFERAPLDAAFAAAARAAIRGPGQAPAASPRCRAFLATLTKRLRPPTDAGSWPALRDHPDRDAGLAFLHAGMADAMHGLFWRGKAFVFALTRGLPGMARSVAEGLAADPELAPLAPRLLAEAAFAWDGAAAGLDALEAVDPELFPRFIALARSHGLVQTGQAEEGTAQLLRLWLGENWHPGLTLRLHALTHPPAPVALEALPGRLFVFLYSWNRAALLAETLDSLAKSRLGPARIVVLDNGGTDDTANVCRAAAGRFGVGHFSALRLPVNIGAPAARNWLAAVSHLGPDDLAAYVDDDVTLPTRWLETLVSVLGADPLADVAGARIVGSAPGAARVAQAADVRLLSPAAAHAVRPLINYGSGPDFGLLASVRPCASVSGCCHLFRGRALAGGAPFDIRFSPSQFDDLARDLGGFLAGRRAVYAGTLAVAHQQHAGPAQAKTSAAVGQLLGARTKLDSLFSTSQMEVAATRDLDTAWDELETKWRELREALFNRLGGPGG
ncbi:MAG: glycosyltransferase family 2 protein [Solidesulfovibrio sp.]